LASAKERSIVLLAPLVDGLAPRGQPMGVGALARVCPDVADDETGGGGVRRTGREQGAGSADGGIAFVVAIAGAVGGGVGEKLALRAWDKRGLLMHFRPEGFDKIAATAKDKNGAWIAVNAIPLFYVYNTEKVQPTEVPKSALDFLKPQFKGKLITVYPSDDDAALYAFYNVVQKYGWSYMDRYMAQEPKFIQGHLGVARSVASGESLVALEDSMTGAISVVRSGGKIALTAPAVDALPIFFTAEAILKDAPHPNAAKLFVSWYLSKDWQSKLGIYSSRNDVPPPEGMRPLSAYRLVNDYRRFVSDEKRLAELRKRFEKYTGPVPKAGAIVR